MHLIFSCEYTMLFLCYLFHFRKVFYDSRAILNCNDLKNKLIHSKLFCSRSYFSNCLFKDLFSKAFANSRKHKYEVLFLNESIRKFNVCFQLDLGSVLGPGFPPNHPRNAFNVNLVGYVTA